MSRDDDIADMFRIYAAAWTLSDSDALMEQIAVPHLIADGRGTTFIEDEAALAAGLEAELTLWRARGHGKATATVTRLTDLPDDAIRAFVDWHIDGVGNVPPVRFAAVYTLVTAGGEWAIATTDISDQARALGGWTN